MVEAKIRLTDNWTFRACGEQEWMPATVPGCVHTDLLRNGRIPDPFYGTNERDLPWIDKQDWEYRTEFEVPEAMLQAPHLILVFAGLDTYADVELNGQPILAADNMFRTWKVDVKQWLEPKGNQLTVRLRSPVKEDLPKLERLGYALPATNDQSEAGGLGDKKISIFARKAPYHYGWDWGPRLVTSGIWRDVWLEAHDVCYIDDLFIQQVEVGADLARLKGIAEVVCAEPWSGVLRIRADDHQWETLLSLDAGRHTVALDMEIAKPRLWWCRGLGEQHMYTFQAELLRENKRVAERLARTGLRSIRLVQEQDVAGRTFYFELNGIPIFAKGANHIPNDSFLTEITYERYRHEIASAALANMNMLRVWGGGIYEDDMFYDLCDEYGILVWQDFMFACSMYPGDEAFLRSVRLEAEDNVKRLRNHPCIALWCGNNEIDTAWSHYNEHAGWGWKKAFEPEIRDKLWRDYEELFHRLLPEVVNRLAPGMAYWPSSPLCEWTGDIRQHATNRSTSGDIHYWGVWHNVEPFDQYNVNIGRFVSEYGFQSFPEYRTVLQYAEPSDLAIDSDVMLAHQRNNQGNQLIAQYMKMYLPEPRDFASFLYMSQLLQAEAMKTAIEAHRRKMPYCMGSLYWQINDCWPAISWSSIDYYGRWKAIHYFAKRSFRDLLVSIDGSQSGQVDVYVVSDEGEAASGTLQIRLYDALGTLLRQTEQSILVPARTAVKAATFRTAELLGEHDPAVVVLQAAFIRRNGEETVSEGHYFVPMGKLKLTAPSIRVRRLEEDGGVRFMLETDVLAKAVWLQAEAEGIFSDNFFDLIPGQPRTVEFHARSEGQSPFVPADPGAVTVRSLVDFAKPRE